MVYLEILMGRAVFDGRSSLKTWLFAVVRNTALRLGAAARRARTTAEPRADPAAANGTDLCAHALNQHETRKAVLGALEILPPQQRQVVELVYYHDLTVAEAAAAMGIGVGSARQHFHRAKRALAAALWPQREALGDG